MRQWLLHGHEVLLVEVIAGDHPDADPTRVRDAAAGLLAAICGLREALTGTDELRRLPQVLRLLATGIAAALRAESTRPLPSPSRPANSSRREAGSSPAAVGVTITES